MPFVSLPVNFRFPPHVEESAEAQAIRILARRKEHPKRKNAEKAEFKRAFKQYVSDINSIPQDPADLQFNVCKRTGTTPKDAIIFHLDALRDMRDHSFELLRAGIVAGMKFLNVVFPKEELAITSKREFMIAECQKFMDDLLDRGNEIGRIEFGIQEMMAFLDQAFKENRSLHVIVDGPLPGYLNKQCIERLHEMAKEFGTYPTDNDNPAYLRAVAERLTGHLYHKRIALSRCDNNNTESPFDGVEFAFKHDKSPPKARALEKNVVFYPPDVHKRFHEEPEQDTSDAPGSSGEDGQKKKKKKSHTLLFSAVLEKDDIKFTLVEDVHSHLPVNEVLDLIPDFTGNPHEFDMFWTPFINLIDKQDKYTTDMKLTALMNKVHGPARDILLPDMMKGNIGDYEDAKKRLKDAFSCKEIRYRYYDEQLKSMIPAEDASEMYLKSISAQSLFGLRKICSGKPTLLQDVLDWIERVSPPGFATSILEEHNVKAYTPTKLISRMVSKGREARVASRNQRARLECISRVFNCNQRSNSDVDYVNN